MAVAALLMSAFALAGVGAMLFVLLPSLVRVTMKAEERADEAIDLAKRGIDHTLDLAKLTRKTFEDAGIIGKPAPTSEPTSKTTSEPKPNDQFVRIFSKEQIPENAPEDVRNAILGMLEQGVEVQVARFNMETGKICDCPDCQAARAVGQEQMTFPDKETIH